MTKPALTTIDRRHRWTINELHRLVQSGALTPDDRLELIEGDLIDMAPIGPEHADVVDELTRQLGAQLPDGHRLRVQNPIILGERSEPEPDIVIARPRDVSYRQRHPGVADVALLIEVADTTADFDRQVKLPLYAAHSVAEVWLVDLRQRSVTVYRKPKQGRYAETAVFTEGELAALNAPGVTVQIARLFEEE